MNVDDPKLTAFALDELEEPEKSTIAREIAESPQARRYVDETRDFAATLKKEFAAELEPSYPANLIDIRDDRWFWTIGRPVAIAATIAVAALVIALIVAPHRQPSSNAAASTHIETFELPPVEKSFTETSEVKGPEQIPNPLSAEMIQQVDRVVIGELPAGSSDGELQVVETIRDSYRLQHLRQRLTTSVLSKTLRRWNSSRDVYHLVFLDPKDRVVAVAAFHDAPGFGFGLQLLEYGYERQGHYFLGRTENNLPGNWISGIDYSGYVIPFSDWQDAVGYSPGT